MTLNKINEVLTTAMLVLFGVVAVGTVFSLAVPQALMTVVIALFLLGIVTAVNFVLTFYLLVQYISSLMKQMDLTYEEQEENDDQRDSSESNEEANARDNPNAETNGDNGQEKESQQNGLQKLPFTTIMPLDMNTINERIIEREKAKLTDGVNTTRGKF